MSVTASTLAMLSELRAAGLRLAPRTDGLIHVAPLSRVTPELRERIISNRDALLAALDAEARMQTDLAQRIRAMAIRWRYSPEELVEALEAAKANPASWLWTVGDDEAKAQDWQDKSWLPRGDV